jgi:hypothetical protein
MRRTFLAALAVLALLAGCGAPSIFDVAADPGANDCAGPDALAYGRDPVSGACVMFASRCDVPAEWAACTPLVACVDDSGCSTAQHCADVPPPRAPGAPARACTANDPCGETADCGVSNQICVVDPATMGAGTCTRTDSTNPPPPPPPPSMPTCQATSDCGALELCPAQYGGCSPDQANPVNCPSYCEKACVADSDCADPTTLRCNAADVCAMSSNDAMGNPGLACAGWCVRRM